MQKAMMDRLWALYGKHVESVQESGRVARVAFGFRGLYFFNVHPLSRDQFEICVTNQSGDPIVRRSWLNRMLAFEQDNDTRRRLEVELGLSEIQSTLKGPHFTADNANWPAEKRD